VIGDMKPSANGIHEPYTKTTHSFIGVVKTV